MALLFKTVHHYILGYSFRVHANHVCLVFRHPSLPPGFPKELQVPQPRTLAGVGSR